MAAILDCIEAHFADAHEDIECIFNGTFPLYVPDEDDIERTRQEEQERLHAMLTNLKKAVMQLTAALPTCEDPTRTVLSLVSSATT